jgi:hypothetical protein
MYETQNVFKCIMDVRGAKFIWIFNKCKRHKIYLIMYNVDVRNTKCIWIFNKCKRNQIYSADILYNECKCHKMYLNMKLIKKV